MEPKKTPLNISGIIAWLTLVVGVVGYLYTRNYFFLNIMFFIMGLNFVIFSHALALNQVIKFNFNYKFVRGVYIVVGLLLVLIAARGHLFSNNVSWINSGGYQAHVFRVQDANYTASDVRGMGLGGLKLRDAADRYQAR
jgi:hypothetical protein